MPCLLERHVAPTYTMSAPYHIVDLSFKQVHLLNLLDSIACHSFSRVAERLQHTQCRSYLVIKAYGNQHLILRMNLRELQPPVLQTNVVTGRSSGVQYFASIEEVR